MIWIGKVREGNTTSKEQSQSSLKLIYWWLSLNIVFRQVPIWLPNFPHMAWVNPWLMVFRHLPRVPLSVVVNIMKFYRTPIAAVKIKHANHYTIGPSNKHETALSSPILAGSIFSIFLTRSHCRAAFKLVNMRSHCCKNKDEDYERRNLMWRKIHSTFFLNCLNFNVSSLILRTH